MARKETYRSKNQDKLPQGPTGGNNSPVDPAIQQHFLEGAVILINKDLHWTSFDVIRKLRSILKIKKIGHAGTLDPLATGVLIVCTGKFTRKINEYMAEEKEYTGQITLGALTPTYDLESEPEQFKDYTFITPAQIQEAAAGFLGTLQQLPPVYSAIKKDGIPLYKLARKGAEVELKPREVIIKQFEIIRVALPLVEFRVVCSTGTYIRSLAHDLGQQLGCGAYLSKLCRTRVGNFHIEETQTMEEFTKNLTLPSH